ncbi:tail fiber assembly protein [Edwardsiella tarda]
MVKAELNNDLIATVAGEITVYNYDGDTREYLSSSIEYLAIGVGIPALSCIDDPGESKTGFAICRSANFSSWELVADHRGETVYDTVTNQPAQVTELGDYSINVTPIKPSTPYDKWDGSKWVTDVVAQHAAEVTVAEDKKATLLDEANTITADWRTELALGIISNGDKAKLIAWMEYIKAVKAVDTSTVPNVVWPLKPEV